MSRAAFSAEIEYPSSDGQPIAENTLQFEWIVALKGSLDRVFRDDPNAFVAGDLLWYPAAREQQATNSSGRYGGIGTSQRLSRLVQQWLEGNIAPQVVFEVLSPGNRAGEMTRKYEFYNKYGVQEYYLIDPDKHTCDGWTRQSNVLEAVESINGWTSPLLGIRLQVSDGELVKLFQPDGLPFLTYSEVVSAMEDSRQLAEQESARAERLAAKLRELGVDPNKL